MRNTRLAPYLLIAPSLLFLAVLFLVPLVQTVALAFQADGPGGAAWSTANFARMAGDLNFADAIINTFEIVVIVVPLQLCLALGMAMMLRHVQRGRDIVLWIWSIPLGISDLAAGLVWLAILTDQGYLNTVLNWLGVVKGPQSWLSYETPIALLAAIVVAEAWRATAIVLVILVAGVQLVPKEYGEAADVFGATPWQRFTKIMLPLLKPSIQTALILRTVLAFEMFAIVLSLGGRNFPVLVSEAFTWQYANQNFGVAAAYAVVVMVISLAATLVYLLALRTPPEQR
ncbi:carbohydrate ABC transporter permease [Limobrevibacterium gyesilva]|uniref:Sugar ABC transporter permease n=1 Tax=Limobrevibacterium gyesilva TaxID=2991712 RepID=A0AA41YTW9_9PROT|nr:sugar ABC transporter permease [Limobrevibacterium gyesilva]MCW3475347.1 sugar ABC transporter permease [Limobrevibacterium gyesilva]